MNTRRRQFLRTIGITIAAIAVGVGTGITSPKDKWHHIVLINYPKKNEGTYIDGKLADRRNDFAIRRVFEKDKGSIYRKSCGRWIKEKNLEKIRLEFDALDKAFSIIESIG